MSSIISVPFSIVLKFVTLVGAMVVFSLSPLAQNASPELLSTAGGSAQVGLVHFDWSFGEAVILTMETTEVILTNGFHQNERFCPGDFNGDGVVNAADLAIFIGQFGCEGICEADLNLDGLVNILDLNLFLTYFGNQCW